VDGILLPLLALFTVFAMVSCSNPADPPPFIPPITTYTVTFDANGGTFTGGTTSTVTVVKDTVVTAPAVNPTRTGTATQAFTFESWHTASTIQTAANEWDFTTLITADITLYAKWQSYNPSTTVVVTLNGNGGSVSPGSLIVTKGQAATGLGSVTGTRSGFTLSGWNTVAGGGGIAYTATGPVIDADITLYAQWTAVSTATYVTFNYENGSTERVEVELGETTWADVLAGLSAAKRTDTKAGYVFGYWKDATGTKWDTATKTIDTELTFTAYFYNPALSTDGALEKVWLNNTQFAIYEFDITGKDYTTITHISADFKASEVTINTLSTRPIRPMGPYFYSDTPTTASDGWKYYGDFVPDANGAYAAKFNSDGTKVYTDFNKFHPFLLNSVDPGWSKLSGYNSADGTQVPGNTWFNVKVPTSGYSWSSGTNSPARVKGFIEADTTHTILSADADFNKVYFGFGIANSAKPEDANSGYTAKVNEHGITTLVKNVTIYFADNTTVTGTIPAFPKRTQTIEGGVSTIVPGAGTTDQVFAAYIYKNQYNWRGAPGATIVPPTDPTVTYTPPAAPQATVDYVVTTPTLALFQNDVGKTDSRKRVTIDNNTVTFDLQVGDHNNGAPNGFGGGGCKVEFADLDLPAVEGETTFLSYKSIIFNITISSDFVGADKQIIFSDTRGTPQDIPHINGATGSNTQYVTIGTAGATKDFKIAIEDVYPDATGIALRTNNWEAANIPIIGTLTVNSITFSKDD